MVCIGRLSDQQIDYFHIRLLSFMRNAVSARVSRIHCHFSARFEFGGGPRRSHSPGHSMNIDMPASRVTCGRQSKCRIVSEILATA